MIQLRREDILDLLGELDDERAAELIATGASRQEFGEEVAAVQSEIELGERSPEPASPRSAALRDLLREVLSENDNDEER
jgi:hypothetical protein